jgi:hypothetical protein
MVTRLSAVMAIGVAIGVATSFVQAPLSMPWAALANSASGGLVTSGSTRPARNFPSNTLTDKIRCTA